MEQEIKFDPVSGNEVPPGATPNEVRDDIDAKLSENEYVLPANVVKYYGLKFIEGMVEKANKGWEEMEAKGRVGGKPQDPEGLSDEDRAMLEEVMSEGEPTGFAEGGFSSKGYNFKEVPAKPDFLQGANPVDPSGGTAGTGVETKTFYGPGGAVRYIMFVNGSPINAIPEGFTEKKPEETVAEKTDEQEQYLKDTKDGGWRERLEEDINQASAKKDYSTMSAEDLKNDAIKGLEFGSMVEKGLGGLFGGMLGMINPVAGMIGKKVGPGVADNFLGIGLEGAVAKAYSLEQAGYTDEADAVYGAIYDNTRYKNKEDLMGSKAWTRGTKDLIEFNSGSATSATTSGTTTGLSSGLRSALNTNDDGGQQVARERAESLAGAPSGSAKTYSSTSGSSVSNVGGNSADTYGTSVRSGSAAPDQSSRPSSRPSGGSAGGSNSGGFDEEEEKWGTGPMNKGGLVVKRTKAKGQTTTKRKGLASKKRT